jgi:hypothetical protein
MTVVLAALGVIGLGIVAFWYFGSKPVKHRNLTPERITTLVEMLLERGADGGALFIKERGGARFVQFAKYVGHAGRVGIQTDFPLAPWSEPFYEGVCRCITKLGLTSREMNTGREDTKRFLTVDFGRNVKQATAFITCVVEEVFALSLVRDCQAHLVGVAPR